jgi:hypothetical protein
MPERDIVLLIQVLLSFVKEIHDGGAVPNPATIQQRLRSYDQTVDRLILS